MFNSLNVTKIHFRAHRSFQIEINVQLTFLALLFKKKGKNDKQLILDIDTQS